MSLANKFLRYFHRVHFGENKKHNLVPSHLPQTKAGFTGTWSSGTTLIGGWWWKGEGGIGKAFRAFHRAIELLLWNVICKWVTQNLCTHVSSLRQVAWHENNMSLLLLHVLWPNLRMHWPMQSRERTLQGSNPFLNKKFKDFSRTFKDTFPIFHFHCCGLAETTGSRWLNFVLHDEKT